MNRCTGIESDAVNAFLDYNSETGLFKWKHPEIRWFRNPHAFAIFSGQHAGKEAMTVDRGNGYLCGQLFGSLLLAHRVAWCISFSRWPEYQIDHINGDRKDNRLCNLRAAEHGENSMNRGMLRNNTSGYKGVNFHKSSGLWRASIKSYGVNMEKLFKSKEDANDWRMKMSELTHGEFCNHG